MHRVVVPSRRKLRLCLVKQAKQNEERKCCEKNNDELELIIKLVTMMRKLLSQRVWRHVNKIVRHAQTRACRASAISAFRAAK